MRKLKINNYQLIMAGFLACVLLFGACGMLFYHDPQKARATAYKFLSAVYMQGDFKKAYGMVDADFNRNFGAGYLEKNSIMFAKVFDRLDGLRAYAYLSEKGERSMMVLFTGLSEKKPSYHKVMLVGDGGRGYWVSSVLYSDIPFKDYRQLNLFK